MGSCNLMRLRGDLLNMWDLWILFLGTWFVNMFKICYSQHVMHNMLLPCLGIFFWTLVIPARLLWGVIIGEQAEWTLTYKIAGNWNSAWSLCKGCLMGLGCNWEPYYSLSLALVCKYPLLIEQDHLCFNIMLLNLTTISLLFAVMFSNKHWLSSKVGKVHRNCLFCGHRKSYNVWKHTFTLFFSAVEFGQYWQGRVLIYLSFHYCHGMIIIQINMQKQRVLEAGTFQLV